MPLGCRCVRAGQVLLDYLMMHGDADFSGFVFNSPFLDWGWVGGVVNKLGLMRVCSLKALSAP